MPTFLDIKIPLVQNVMRWKTYLIQIIIYFLRQILGFQIVYEAELPFTSLDPETKREFYGYIEVVVIGQKYPGWQFVLSTIPPIGPPVPIPLVVYDQLDYLDSCNINTIIDDDGNPQFEIDESGNPVPIEP